MIETKIACDGCGKDIDPTTNYMAEAYIQMSPVYKKGKSEYRYATYGRIPIKETLQFCGIGCVGVWYHEVV
jgi:hypothetical protein